MKFLIMNGAGNRFAVFDARKTPRFALSEAQVKDMAAPGSKAMGEKGADQIIVIRAPKSQGADVFMEIWNQKGFEVDACGNATRCIAWLVMEEEGSDSMVLETNDGLLLCGRAKDNEAGDPQISVDMGPPKLDWTQIPLKEVMHTHHVDVKVGPIDDPFPEQVNVGFAKVEGPDRIRLKVWERGVGMTQACGTGACAALVAAVRQKRIGRKAVIEVDGGQLEIEWRESDDHVIMTGPVELEGQGRI